MDHLCGSTCITKAREMLKKARKHKNGGYKNILDRWNNDDKYRKSLSDIGRTEEQIIRYDAIALEDHSFVATWQERSRNEKYWKISLRAEGIQRPLNQRSDLKEMKQKCKRLYDEHAAITGDRNKPIPPGQQVWQRLDRQFEGLEEYDCRLEARTGWRFYPSSRTTHSSSSSHWQPSSDWKSNRSWGSWQTSSWTEQYFFFFVQRCYFACLKFNLLAIDGACRQHTYRAPRFSHAQLLHRLVFTCCQSVQSH